MTKWTGEIRGKLRQILIDRFPEQSKLKMWLDEKCDVSQDQLAQIGGDNLATWVYNLLQQANADGWINQLFLNICSTTKDSNKISQLREIVMELNDRELTNAVDKIFSNTQTEKPEVIERISSPIKQLRAVILTALPVEFESARSFLTDTVEKICPETQNVYELGKFAANGKIWEVGLAEIGAGNPGAALEAERAIAFFKPQVIFFVGIAGGIKDVRIGDVVAATKIYGYESGKAEQEIFKPRPELGQSSYALIERAKAERRNNNWLQRLTKKPEPLPRAFIGAIAAGEKVVASTQSDVCQFLKNNYSDALAVEMEGYGFLKAAYANQSRVLALVVRGISDLIDNKNDNIEQETEEVRQQKASLHASAFAFQILARFEPIDRLTGPPPPPQVVMPGWDSLLPQPTQPPDDTHGYLLIALDPIDDCQNVAFTAEVHSPDSPPKTDLLPPGQKCCIDGVDSLLSKAILAAGNVKTIEFFLPWQHLKQPVHKWEIQVSQRLGKRRRALWQIPRNTIVRSLDRLKEQDWIDEWIEDMKSLWTKLRGLTDAQLPDFCGCLDGLDFDKLTTVMQDKLVFKFLTNLPDEEENLRDLLSEVLFSKVLVWFWSYSCPKDCNLLSSDIDTILSSTNLQDSACFAEAICKNRQNLPDLGVLCDCPTRLPVLVDWKKGSLRQPTQSPSLPA